MPELRYYKLKSGEIHTRPDETTLDEAYLTNISVFAEPLKKHAVIQWGLWKDRTIFEGILAGTSTVPPVMTFPIEINGSDFDSFAADTALFASHLETFLQTHSPSNLENIDFSQWEREAEGTGITLPSIIALLITGLVFFVGMWQFMASNFPDHLAFHP